MKFTVIKPVEIEVAVVELRLPIRYGEEDIPKDFPLRVEPDAGQRKRKRDYDFWVATVQVHDGRILGWPFRNQDHELNMKVCDEGVYILRDNDGKELARLEDYVPDLVPGEYGDYVNLKINAEGYITNWPKKPSLRGFFPEYLRK